MRLLAGEVEKYPLEQNYGDKIVRLQKVGSAENQGVLYMSG